MTPEQQLLEIMNATGASGSSRLPTNPSDQLKAAVANNPSARLLELRAKYKASKGQTVAPAPAEAGPTRLQELRAKRDAGRTPPPPVPPTQSLAPFSVAPFSKNQRSEEGKVYDKATQQNVVDMGRDTTQSAQNTFTGKYNEKLPHPYFAAVYGAAMGEPDLVEYLGEVNGEPQYRVTEKGAKYSLRDLPEIKALGQETRNYEALRDLYKDTALTGAGSADLTPLYSYVDARTGSNMARNYRAPASETDAILGMGQDIFKQRSDAAKRLTDIMKGATTIDYGQTIADKLAQAVKDSSGTKTTTGGEKGTSTVTGTASETGTKPISSGSGKSPEERFIAEIKTDPGVKDYKKALEMLGTLSDNMEAVDLYPVLSQTVKALARVNDDRLSEADIAIAKRFDPSWGARLERWSREGGLISGEEPPLPPKDKVILMQSIKFMRGSLEDRVKEYARNRSGTASAYGIKPERGVELFFNVLGQDPTRFKGKPKNTQEAVKVLYPDKDQYDKDVKSLQPSEKKESASERWRKKMEGKKP